MAREAYRSLYGDLTKLKDDSALKDPANGAGDDDELFQLLLAVSDWVDHYCNRHFYPRLQTLEFDGSGGPNLLAPDLISVTALREDTNGDGAFDAAWPQDDYRMLPPNAAPTSHWGAPFNLLRARAKGGRPGVFKEGERNFQVDGVWGYRWFTEYSGANVTDSPITPSAATVAVDDGGQFHVGQTIQIGTEQLLVTSVSGNSVHVTRGLNGAAPAEHQDGANIHLLRWPPSVERAALIQTSRIWTRAADFEPFYVDADVDTDVRTLLEPYRKLSS